LGGDGPLAAEAQSMLAAADVRHLAWVRGERIDVPDVMCGLGGFVLVSQAEGISNSILEAMACACPVLATRVGGNAERVDARTASTTGELVPPGDVEAMARALAALAADWVRAARMGKGRVRRVEQHFSLQAMVGDRQGLCAWPLCRS
jgi:glycosyltransferase involved in cell wall biosynthesis